MKNLINLQYLTELSLSTYLERFNQSDLSKEVDLLDADERLINRVPNGKGILIWQLKKCADGNMELLAQKARESNFKWVSIKVAERKTTYNVPLINDAIRELRENGIAVWGWGYIYGDDPIGEAESNANIISQLNLDGYFIDAESEYKRPNMKEKAKIYTKRLSDLTNKPLGLCSYRYPEYHREFPFAEFLEICDFHAPQLYWIGANKDNAPQIQMEVSWNQLKKIRDLPFVPIGVACSHPLGDKIWNPTVKQLENFRDYCESKDLGYGYYNWDAAEKNPDWWKVL